MFGLNYIQSFFGLGKIAQTALYTAKSPEDSRLEKQVKQEHSEFLAKEGIRPELHIWEQHSFGYAGLRGINISGLAEPIIKFTPKLKEIDPQAFNWIFKQQIYHLKYNHALSQALLQTTASTVSQFGLNYLDGLIASVNPLGPMAAEIGKQFAIYQISNKISSWYAYYCTTCADSYAISHSTPEENKGARRELKALQLAAKTFFGPKHPNVCENGDILLPNQPTYSERLKKIDAALLQAGSDVEKLDSNPHEKRQIDRLVELVKEQNLYAK